MPQKLKPPIENAPPKFYFEHGLRKVVPYNYTFATFAKERWYGRSILEVFCTEFRETQDNAPSVYDRIKGSVRVNEKVVPEDYILGNGDLITNVMHRHEPPVVGKEIKVLHRDEDKGLLVVEKPGSVPVHATGRYHHNSLLSILKFDLNLKLVHTCNRLDRLTSGVMICSTNKDTSKKLAELFVKPGGAKEGGVSKEYVCRVVGHFPEEMTCDEPLLTIDRQIGVNVVHPEGRASTTIFRRLSYHEGTNTTAVHCLPLTGRSHQIRVHLQYLGYPIANDPIYNSKEAWGDNVGRGGIFDLGSGEPPQKVTKTTSTSSPSANTNPKSKSNTDTEAGTSASAGTSDNIKKANKESRKFHVYTREDGSVLAPGSEVPLSHEAAHAITTLRHVREKDDQFTRDRDADPEANMALDSSTNTTNASTSKNEDINEQQQEEQEQEQERENVVTDKEGNNYCKSCGVPILPDPKPEQLYIWLHATRYYSQDWDFSSDLPDWARDDWEPSQGDVQIIHECRNKENVNKEVEAKHQKTATSV